MDRILDSRLDFRILGKTVLHRHLAEIEKRQRTARRLFGATVRITAEAHQQCGNIEGVGTADIHADRSAWQDAVGKQVGIDRDTGTGAEFDKPALGDRHGGRAHWDARYTFSGTGRKVLNRIDARFEFRDGLIVRHVDNFDFWRWARQALGVPGWLLGGSSFLRHKVQARAAASLAAFVAKNPVLPGATH